MNLEVGTIKTDIEPERKKRRRVQTGSGGKNSGGRNRGGGGGGGDNNDSRGENLNFEPEQDSPINKFKVGMWFVLLVVMMTFGGLISAYIVIATNEVIEWKPFNLPENLLNLPNQIWISTFLIFASSITYSVSRRFLNFNKQETAKKWLLATAVLGGMFIASQVLAWTALVRQGVYVASNPYAGFFYLLTAVHALHVLGGISVLGYVLLRVWIPTKDPRELESRQSAAKITGWYWHFMDGLWIVLVLLLGFWK